MIAFRATVLEIKIFITARPPATKCDDVPGWPRQVAQQAETAMFGKKIQCPDVTS